MVQIGQASLHGAREAGNPQTVQVVMAPALARDVRPDQLGCHWTHVGGLVDLGGSEERLWYCTHTRRLPDTDPETPLSEIFRKDFPTSRRGHAGTPSTAPP